MAVRVKPHKRAKVRSKSNDYYDYSLLAAVIILICFGLVMLYSASYYEAIQTMKGDDLFYFRKQALISVGAVIMAIVISMIDYHIYAKFAFLLYIAAMGLMAMVRFTPLGVNVNNSRRWLKLGIQFQPSEIAKIAVILFLAVLIVQMGKQIGTLRGFITVLLVGGMQALGAKVFTDNLSTALIILGIACVMIYLAHPRTAPFVVGAVVAVIGIVIVVSYISANMTNDLTTGFRFRRVLTWLDPQSYLDDGGFQVIQGLYAIGSGGFFGKGLGNSEQKLDTIPEAQNDMIFSIICEELGVFGAILVLLMFGYLLYRLFIIAQNAPDLYGSLIVSGIFAHISLQVILNICVVLNVIPTTGITLPFISYGGTSVLFLMAEMGIALSVSRKIRFKDPKPSGDQTQ
ncbi:MAG: putative peptidoglycan glycosyltransferase FtsW [Lachnospiraceae bacterium]|nr:putative peptidoglycan glycosyltransferase FtsW [Lachnospiraceae bacterium]